MSNHDEIKALLTAIHNESVATSNVLTDVLALLRVRLLDAESRVIRDDAGGIITRMSDTESWQFPPIASGGTPCGSVRFGYSDFICTKPPRHEGPHGYAGVFWSDPAPADDLPGEPVEPGDLRAGDWVEYDYEGMRYQGRLVRHPNVASALCSEIHDWDGSTTNITSGPSWCVGISDVRLIERAPREDEGDDEDDPFPNVDERLALSIVTRLPDLGLTAEGALRVARVALTHVDAEGEDAHLERLRAEKAEGVRAILEDRIEFWQEETRLAKSTAQSYLDRAKKAEDERGKWQAEARQQRVRAARAEREREEQRDRAIMAENKRNALRAERDDLKAQYEALQSDVTDYESAMGFVSAHKKVQLLAVKNRLKHILAADRARAAKGEQR